MEQDVEILNLKYSDYFNDKEDITEQYDKLLAQFSDLEDEALEFEDDDEGKEDSQSDEEDIDLQDYDAEDTQEYDIAKEDKKDNNNKPVIKSSFQIYQEKLNKQIAELEQENISEKPWTLSGEVSSKARPNNSLLEEVIEFDQIAKPVPIITEALTESLETLIKRKILKQEFDDPCKPESSESYPSFRQAKTPAEEVSTSKSQASLAQIYESAYQTNVLGYSKDDPLAPAKKNIEQLWNKLNKSLDILTHFHHVAKPIKEREHEAATKNIPSLLLEEKTPLFINENTTLAPEEVFSSKRAPFKSESELSRKEKHLRHLAKKRKKSQPR